MRYERPKLMVLNCSEGRTTGEELDCVSGTSATPVIGCATGSYACGGCLAGGAIGVDCWAGGYFLPSCGQGGSVDAC